MRSTCGCRAGRSGGLTETKVPGHQQFDYPAHTLRVVDAEDTKTVTVSPGAQVRARGMSPWTCSCFDIDLTPPPTQTGLFSNETGVGRLDAHSYRPNEFFANNWVSDPGEGGGTPARAVWTSPAG